MLSKKIFKVKQRDISDCGAACLASISSYYKYYLPLSRIRQYASTDETGTNILGLVEAAEKLGFHAKGVRAEFEHLVELPKPFIAHVVLKNSLHHFVVVYKTTPKQIILMDPAHGDIQKLPAEEFKHQWTGILVLFSPSESFVKSDETTSHITRFRHLASPHKTVMGEALAGAAITTLLGLSTAVYVQKIVDNVLMAGNRNLLNLMSVFMIAILMLQFFIGTMRNIFVLRTGQKMDIQLILGYYKHLMTLPQTFFDTMRTGEIISRLGDAANIRAFINNVCLDLIMSVFTLFFASAVMFIYSWRLALLVFTVVPVYSLIYFIVNRINKKYQRILMERNADLESHLVESLNAMETIKSFGLEWNTNIKMETRFVSLLDTIYQSTLNSIFSGSSTALVSGAITVSMLWMGAGLALDQLITPGELMSCYALVAYINGPLGSLIGANKSIQDALIATDRLFEIIDLEREHTSGSIDISLNDNFDIHFCDVTFRYGARLTLFDKLNFTIQKGKTTGIIGESGSGKTTLVSLIQKLYPLQSGHIRIGDKNIKDIQTKSLRKIISAVPQKIDIFSGNIIENIACGDLEPDMEKIKNICTDIGIDEFIEKLPQGYQTFVGEKGANLSGGEKQRIAIARALYKNPEFLILDEATSSLDSRSEQYIQNTIRSLSQKGKTIIIIAHRMSTVRHADNIIVLKEGKKEEEGTHDTLLQKGGEYKRLWHNQNPVIES